MEISGRCCLTSVNEVGDLLDAHSSALFCPHRGFLLLPPVVDVECIFRVTMYWISVDGFWADLHAAYICTNAPKRSVSAS